MSDNQSVLKQLKAKQQTINLNASKKGGSVFSKLPGYSFFYKTFGQISAKQYLDISLFCGGVFVLYKHGNTISGALDNIMPNEQKMNEMVKEMQNQPGGMP